MVWGGISLIIRLSASFLSDILSYSFIIVISFAQTNIFFTNPFIVINTNK